MFGLKILVRVQTFWRGPPAEKFGVRRKFKPEHTLFCRELRFVAIYALFGDLWAKEVPFGVKNSVSWARSARKAAKFCHPGCQQSHLHNFVLCMKWEVVQCNIE